MIDVTKISTIAKVHKKENEFIKNNKDNNEQGRNYSICLSYMPFLGILEKVIFVLNLYSSNFISNFLKL